MKIDLIHGDCLEEMKNISSGSIDAIITDPPYGTTACKWDSVIPFEPMWEQLNRIIKKNGVIALFGGQPFTSVLIMSNLKRFKYNWVYRKPQGVDPFMAKIRPLNDIEDIVVFCKGRGVYNPQLETGKPYITIRDKKGRINELNGETFRQSKTVNGGTRLPKRIISFKQERGLHPTQKPVPLMEYLIKTYTNENDTILDFTAGSGSTGVACVNTNRSFVGIEKDENYFNIAKKRIREAKEA